MREERVGLEGGVVIVLCRIRRVRGEFRGKRSQDFLFSGA